MNGLGKVGIRHYQQRERHFVPYFSSFQYDVRIAEGGEPETLLHSRFGMVVGVIASQHSLSGNGMGEREHRSIQRHGETVPLRLEELLIRSIAQFQFGRTGGVFFDRSQHITFFLKKGNQVGGLVCPTTCRQLEGET